MLISAATASLADMLQISAALIGAVGGVVGFAVRAATDRRMLENIVLGAALGGLVGVLLGFAAWIGSTLAA